MLRKAVPAFTKISKISKNDMKQPILTADVDCSNKAHDTASSNRIFRGNVKLELPVQHAFPSFGT